MKHNKRSNTGLIFDLLARHAVKFLLENQVDKSEQVVGIIEKYFKRSSPLLEELNIYNLLMTTPINSFETGTRLLSEAKIAASYIEEQKLKDIKFKMLIEIYEVIGQNFFEMQVPNYRSYASVSQLVNDYKNNVKIKNVKEKIVLEEEIISNLIDGVNIDQNKKLQYTFDKRSKLIEKLCYKVYNEEFSNYFSDKDAEVINQFIINKDFSSYAKEKLNEIKKDLNEGLSYINDESTAVKAKKALERIDEVSDLEKSTLAYNIIMYQDLCDEIKKLK
jgi:hypothetical protein